MATHSPKADFYCRWCLKRKPMTEVGRTSSLGFKRCKGCCARAEAAIKARK